MDAKSGMNMGGNARFSSLIADLRDTVDQINDKMVLGITRASTLGNVLNSAVTRLAGATNSVFAGGGGAPTTSVNTVMPQPTPVYSTLLGPNGQPLPSTIMPQPAPATGGGGTGGGGGGGQGGGGLLSPGAAAGIKAGLTAYTIMSQALPNTSDQVRMNYLTNRAIGYGLYNIEDMPGGDRVPGFMPLLRNRREEAYNRVSGVQRQFSQRGTITNPFDAPMAMSVGQEMGIGMALPGYENILAGVGTMSNLTPGAGLQNSMGAYAALQQGRSVNMLRMIGIQARDPLTGQPKSFKDIANQLWDKLNREKLGDEPITKEDLATAFLPGNSLAMMLDNYFGGDEYLKAQVRTAIYARASGVSKAYRKSELLKAGFTTEAITSFSDRQTKAMEGIQQTARAGAGAFTVGNNAAEAMQAAANAMDRLTGVLSGGSFLKGLVGTMGGMANGTPATLFGMLLKKLGLAEGGATESSGAYIVGERGPELFIPKTDGVVIPNHLVNSPNRHEGGGVKHSHSWGFAGASNSFMDTQRIETEKILRQAGFTGEGLKNAMTIVSHESGYNPTALNPNQKTGDYSLGLFQINMLGDLYKERMAKDWKLKGGGTFKLGNINDLYDPLKNAQVAYHMSKGGTDWSAWTTKKYLGSNATPSGNYSGQASSSSSSGGGVFGSIREFLGKLAPNILGDIESKSGMGSSSGGGVTNNYGGVTINVKSTDPKKAAAEVKAIFENQHLNELVGNS